MPMLRTITQTEIRNVAAPLWLLINQTSWPGPAGQFDIIKNGASAIVAHLAYCAIGADERERKNRAKVIPCRVYQDLIASADVDLVAALGSADFVDIEVVRTKFFVAVIIPAHRFLLIGVRGTQFAYDWIINLKVWKKADGHERFHAGFLREARELASAVRERLLLRYSNRIQNPDCAIYLSGHSLGGAVAAVINQMRFPVPINACYMFAAPRIANSQHAGTGLFEPFATRRDLDIVPHCPPKAIYYSNFRNQKATNGDPYVAADGLEFYFFASWLFQLAIRAPRKIPLASREQIGFGDAAR